MKRILVEEMVKIPEGCEVDISNKIFTIKGKKATAVKDLSHFNLTFTISENNIKVQLWNGSSRERSKVITAASVLKNAINGCMIGFEYTCKLIYKHFPMAMEVVDNGKAILIKNFLGEKAFRKFNMKGDSKVRLGSDKDTFIVEGSSIEDVSQSAGEIQENVRVKRLDNRAFLDGVYFINRGLAGEAK